MIGESTMEELLKILSELRPDVDFEKEKGLISDNILDSFDLLSLISELNDAYDIKIKSNDIKMKNFNSAEAILALITKLQDE